MGAIPQCWICSIYLSATATSLLITYVRLTGAAATGQSIWRPWPSPTPGRHPKAWDAITMPKWAAYRRVRLRGVKSIVNTRDEQSNAPMGSTMAYFRDFDEDGTQIHSSCLYGFPDFGRGADFPNFSDAAPSGRDGPIAPDADSPDGQAVDARDLRHAFQTKDGCREDGARIWLTNR